MTTSELRPASYHHPRVPRLWIRETLVVLGILAFGYFAVMLETAPQPWATASERSTELPR